MNYSQVLLETRDDRPTEDHVVQIDGATWDDYERLPEIRGDRSAPRITYLKGRIEIMSPSRDHEGIKSLIGRLVETYCLHAGIRFAPFGSWTLRERSTESGAEPDEWYVFGGEVHGAPASRDRGRLDSGRLDKLEVFSI